MITRPRPEHPPRRTLGVRDHPSILNTGTSFRFSVTRAKQSHLASQALHGASDWRRAREESNHESGPACNTIARTSFPPSSQLLASLSSKLRHARKIEERQACRQPAGLPSRCTTLLQASTRSIVLWLGLTCVGKAAEDARSSLSRTRSRPTLPDYFSPPPPTPPSPHLTLVPAMCVNTPRHGSHQIS